MRQIKFRAWDIQGRQMLSNHEINYSWLAAGVYKSFTPMQFTGLHDKNGKEIYEGDIIDYGGNRFFPITYEINGFGIKFSETHHERTWLNLSAFAVVGNIYEHPELIQKETVS